MYDLAEMSTAYWIAGIAQVVVLTAVGVMFIAILLKQKNNTLYRLMLIIALGALIQNAGYLLELRSVTANEALAGIRMEYIGGAFVATLFLALVLLYCGYSLPKKLFTVLIVLDVMVIASVWTCEFNPSYYTSVDFEANAAIPHIVLGKGWLYYINSVVTSSQILASAVITLHSMRHITGKKQRWNYGLLLMSSLLPMISYILGLMSVFPGFDPAPIGVGLGVIVISFAILVHHAFDLVEIAHENIIQELDEAVLIVDNQYGFVEANNKAKALFTELADYRKRVGVREGKLSYLFKQEQDSELVMDGRIYRIHKNEIVIENALSGYVYILFDITDERRQLENMQRLKEEADRANEAKSSFLAHVSHEVRTPINAVLGMNEMILRDSKDPETHKYSKDIKNAARTLLSIINDILDSSKLESGKMEIVPVEYNVSTLLNDVYNMIVIKANDKQLQLQFEIDPKLPSVLLGDDIRIRQILLNLLSNAVKYTNKGFVALKVSLDDSAKVDQDSASTDDFAHLDQGVAAEADADSKQVAIRYEIIDTGVGIREEDMPHLFGAFERVDLERNRSVEGTGLGMGIVVKLLNLMGSSIEVQSTYGEGSQFSFTLLEQVINAEPIGSFEQNQQQTERAEGYEVSFIAPKAKVLVVDDNQTNRIVFQGLLRDTQVQIQEADSGMACITAVQREHFDVIFMDDMMPGMTGRETFQVMQSMENNLCADTPVVMLTANAIHGEKEKYLAMGFRDFLIKPIDPEQLEAMLGRILPAALVRWSVAELDNRETMGNDNDTLNVSDNSTELKLLTQIEGVNVNYARLHLPNDALLLQTARSFCEAIPQEIEKLQQLIDCISEEEYLADYRLRVHTIKSSAATIGIPELAGIASLAERAARSEDLSRLQVLHPILAEQLKIYYDRLHVLIDAEQTSDKLKENAQMETVLPLLDLLCESLKERDFDAADLLMSKLNEYLYPEELQEPMNRLRLQVMNLEADQACRTAEEMLQYK